MLLAPGNIPPNPPEKQDDLQLLEFGVQLLADTQYSAC